MGVAARPHSMSKPSTKARILEAARELFARRGYAGTSLREICERAGVNNASVNYHFRDKRSLYRLILEELRERVASAPPPAGDTPQEKLYTLVLGEIQAAFSEPDSSARRVSLREMLEPSEDTKSLVRDLVRPQFQRLRELVEELGGKAADEDRLNLVTLSIAGQCNYYRASRALLPSLIGEEDFQRLRPEQVARHITDFTLRALEAR